MRIIALCTVWMVGFFVVVLLLAESFFAVQCGTVPIVGVGFAPDESPVLIRMDGQVEHWGGIFDRATYLYINGHTGFIDGIAYSPDGKILASASEDHTVRLWDGNDGHYLATLTADTPQTGVAFIPDSKFLLSTGMDGTWILWDISSGKKVKSVVTPDAQAIGTAAFSPDGRYLVVGTSEGDIYIFNVSTEHVVASYRFPGLTEKDALGNVGGYPTNIESVTFAPDGNSVLIANLNADQSVYRFDAHSWTVLDKYPASFPECATYSPDGQLGLVCDTNQLTLWNLKQHKVLGQFPSGSDNAVFSTAGNTYWVLDWFQTLNEYDVRTGTSIQHIPLPFQSPMVKDYPWRRPIAISPDGFRVVTSSVDGRVRVFDTRTGQPQQVLFGHTASVLGGQVIGDELLTYSDDRTAILWDISTGTLIKLFEGQWGPVTAAALSPDKRYLLTASGAHWGDEIYTVRLWDVQTGQILHTFTHTAAVSAVNFSTDSQYALTGTIAGDVSIWLTASGKQQQTLAFGTEPVNTVALDDSTLIVGTSRHIIETAFVNGSGNQGASLSVSDNHLKSLVIAPGTRWFATIESDETRLWDAQRLTPVRVLVTGSVNTLAFSSDGNTILTENQTGKPQLLDTQTGAELRILCPHPLTRRWLVASVLIGTVLELAMVRPFARMVGYKGPSRKVL